MMEASQDDIYTVLARVTYIVDKGYHPNNLLSFIAENYAKSGGQ